MRVTFWLNGAPHAIHNLRDEPLSDVLVGDRMWVQDGIYVVSERWSVPQSHLHPGWHIVLRLPETPAETTPPWDRVRT